MTANWVTQVSFDPKWVAVSIERGAVTHELIESGGVFSICLIDREDRAIVRKFTKPVDVDLEAMTLNGFPFHDGATGTPVLDQSPAHLDCEVRYALDLGDHTFFVGEVLRAERDESKRPLVYIESSYRPL